MDFDGVQNVAAAARRNFGCQFDSSRSTSQNSAESKKGPDFPEKEKEREGKEQERKEMGEIKEGVTTPALVILQQTAEQDEKSGDARLEGNRVGQDMVNILVQGLDGKHVTMKIARGARVSQLCMEPAKRTGIPQDAFLSDSAGKETADRR